MKLKLKVPELSSQSLDRRMTKYLTHCNNVALIMAHADSVDYARARIKEYIRITNAEHEE